MNTTTNKKTTIIIGAILVVLVAGFSIMYILLGPKTVAGNKNITIVITNPDSTNKEYTIKTTKEYLLQTMQDNGMIDKSIECKVDTYIDTINGVTADYDADQSYWMLYINGEAANTGFGGTPVNNGDKYEIVYTIYNVEN